MFPRTGPGSGKSLHGLFSTRAYSPGVTTMPRYPWSLDCVEGIVAARSANVFTNALMLVAFGRGPHVGSTPMRVFASSYDIATVDMVNVVFEPDNFVNFNNFNVALSSF